MVLFLCKGCLCSLPSPYTCSILSLKVLSPLWSEKWQDITSKARSQRAIKFLCVSQENSFLGPKATTLWHYQLERPHISILINSSRWTQPLPHNFLLDAKQCEFPIVEDWIFLADYKVPCRAPWSFQGFLKTLCGQMWINFFPRASLALLFFGLY